MLPFWVLAAENPDPVGKLNIFAEKSGYEITAEGAKSPAVYIGQVLSVIYGFLGVIALGYVVYAGFLWLTAKGDQAKIDESKEIISSAVIGMVILMGAYTLTNFVVLALAG
ncbi:MAG: Uncharacterized protein G01um101418_314 [Parcubacteria group bacterium Gr01-1014_18]|nr:MAG: Uncharacterized protein Greene041636_310 [Parcubacteria group bacterium Greene0416_36]TSC81174.1 MAG: Uncharacterized protein G01um101418_314 [Parcubacteria group bacterium Gr01-1014_18]TSC99171.1 MAG: Uncharacterized protein Greene101420_316 [Parcubacteria group bacterium Greene1014_20]TSD07471.1 MAG: Uncharacterized protein Greene07142_170 [Parcubacteria group bacterium Greene0714_2]